MAKRPRCGKPLPKGGICNSPEGHPYTCRFINRVEDLAYSTAWAASHPGHKATTTANWRRLHPDAQAVWCAENPGRRREHKKHARQKRRAALAGATTEPFTKAELKARMASFGDACYYCALLGIVGPHECDDHVFPIEPRKGHKPGPHALRNLVPSCNKHNKQKSNKPPMEFITKLLLVG